jgi:hypothetical protein
VTKPHHETPPRTRPGACQHCAAPLATTRAGRPARYCGPPCRQAAHRTRATVTKPRNETRCATCNRAFTPTGAGRPARHCSAACRTRAWRRASRGSRSHQPPAPALSPRNQVAPRWWQSGGPILLADDTRWHRPAATTRPGGGSCALRRRPCSPATSSTSTTR